MARVTVEDCIVKIPNRFDLVMVAAQRARDVSGGMQLTIDRDNDKNPVVARARSPRKPSISKNCATRWSSIAWRQRRPPPRRPRPRRSSNVSC